MLHAAAQRAQTVSKTAAQDLPTAVATVEDLIDKGIYLNGPKVGKLLLGKKRPELMPGSSIAAHRWHTSAADVSEINV